MTTIKRISAAAALLLALVGIPTILLLTAGNPISANLSIETITRVFTQRDDGSMLVHLVIWLCWIAWAYFAVALVIETISQLRAHRTGAPLRVPGLRPGRHALAPIVSIMLGLSITAGTTTMPAFADTPQPAPITATVTPSKPTTSAPDTTSESTPTAQTKKQTQPAPDLRHTVTKTDSLWDLAEGYYGDGMQWRRIADANRQLVGPDANLRAGMVLVIPGIKDPKGDHDFIEHTVTSADTLSALAKTYLGDADRWPEIYAASQPIEQADGQHISDPDLIIDGWTLHIPTARKAPAQQATTPATTAAAHKKNPQPEAQPATAAAQPTQAPRTHTPASPDSAPQTAAAHAQQTPATHEAAPVEAHVPAATAPATTPSTAENTSDTSDTTTITDASDTNRSIAGIGGVLAVCLLGILGSRWRRQAARRRPGQRIPALPETEAATVSALQQSEGPLTAVHLDQALRSLSLLLGQQDRMLPPLLAVRLDDDRIDLILAEDTAAPPAPFVADDASARAWSYVPDPAQPLPDATMVPAPYPALVTLGRDDTDAHLLVDLETLGALAITDNAPEEIVGVLALELATSTWADDLAVTLVGACPELPGALQVDRLNYVADLDELIEQLERDAAETSQRLTDDGLAAARDGRTGEDAETWTPHVVLVSAPIGEDHAQRLGKILTDKPRVSIAAVTTDDRKISTWALVSNTDGEHATLEPLGLAMVPQRMPAELYASICQVSIRSLSDATEPAPWWNHDEHAQRPVEEPSLYNTDGDKPTLTLASTPKTVVVGEENEAEDESPVIPLHQPTLRLMGQIRMDNVAEDLPAGRSVTEVLEPVIYVHLHPGDLTKNYQAALATHTTNVNPAASRARRYLGTTADGEKLFPDSVRTDLGRTYTLHPSVTSDWAKINELTQCGINTTGTRNLWRALELVEGRPLESVAPGQWPWIEETRNDMIAMLLDIAHEVADRALIAGDADKAAWAVKKGHMIDPLSETIDRDELRLHRLTGNASGAQGVIDRILKNCRKLGLEPDDETRALIHSSHDDARHMARA